MLFLLKVLFFKGIFQIQIQTVAFHHFHPLYNRLCVRRAITLESHFYLHAIFHLSPYQWHHHRLLYEFNVYKLIIYLIQQIIILPPTDLQLAFYVSTHFLAIFQGPYSIQFDKGSSSKKFLMPVLILSILSYFSQSTA